MTTPVLGEGTLPKWVHMEEHQAGGMKDTGAESVSGNITILSIAEKGLSIGVKVGLVLE